MWGLGQFGCSCCEQEAFGEQVEVGAAGFFQLIVSAFMA
jgi:hypothetical protein